MTRTPAVKIEYLRNASICVARLALRNGGMAFLGKVKAESTGTNKSYRATDSEGAPLGYFARRQDAIAAIVAALNRRELR